VSGFPKDLEAPFLVYVVDARVVKDGKKISVTMYIVPCGAQYQFVFLLLVLEAKFLFNLQMSNVERLV